MRVVFTAADLAVELAALQTGFTAIADRFGMDWQMRDRASHRRVMLLVSKSGPLPGRYSPLAHRRTSDDPDRCRSPTIRARFSAISISVRSCFTICRSPRRPAREQEQAVLKLVQDTDTDLVVLARYGILSDEMSAQLSGRCINIHHSFLPGSRVRAPTIRRMSAASS